MTQTELFPQTELPELPASARKSRTRHSHIKWSGNNNYTTPDYLLQALDMEFGFTLDPCPFNPNWTVDGLNLDWTGERVFCNPPWSDITPWVEKAYESNALTVFLLPARTDTGWFARMAASPENTEIRLFRRRVHFLRDGIGGNKAPSDGTMVAVVRQLSRCCEAEEPDDSAIAEWIEYTENRKEYARKFYSHERERS
jgi:hypothetical protein